MRDDAIRASRAEARPATASKTCGCSGVRWCARCLDPGLRTRHKMDPPEPLPVPLRERPTPGAADVHTFDVLRQRAPGRPDFLGVRVLPEVISESDAERLLGAIARHRFSPAQSGKQKQHFGPRINFNKRRINASAFRGLPAYAGRLEEALRRHFEAVAAAREEDASLIRQGLAAFETTDLFVLRYEARECSNLDLHVDDTFAYGETILDLNLESDTVLTFALASQPGADGAGACVRVPLPARGAALLCGPARHRWEHGILHYDVDGRRTSLTFRTLSEPLRATAAGQQVLSRARGPTAPFDFD